MFKYGIILVYNFLLNLLAQLINILQQLGGKENGNGSNC